MRVHRAAERTVLVSERDVHAELDPSNVASAFQLSGARWCSYLARNLARLPVDGP